MEPLNATKTAFLAIHLQNDIVSEGGAFTPIFQAELERNETLKKSKELLDEARSAGSFVCFARIGFAEDYSDMVDNVPLLQMGKANNALVNNTWQTEINEEVTPQTDDLVLTHTRTSPFCDTDLDETLRGREIDTVVVLGVATNASVEDTARWAANLGYRTIIASDASSAAAIEAHEATLASFGLFGEVATNEELSAALKG